MRRTLGLSMFAVLLIYSARLYIMQELFFFLGIVAVLCGFGAVVVAVIVWARQIARRGLRWILMRTRRIPDIARFATGEIRSHIARR